MFFIDPSIFSLHAQLVADAALANAEIAKANALNEEIREAFRACNAADAIDVESRVIDDVPLLLPPN